MKIAILSCFYPYRGGISQFNACLLNELSREHIVRAFNFSRQYPEFLFPGKTQYVTPDDEAVPVESTSLLDTVNPFSYARTAREIAKWKPDVLIVRYWMSWFAPSLGYVCRRLRKKGCKVISILDNVVPHEPHFFDAPLTRYFLSGSDGCVTLCKAVSEDLLKLKPGAKLEVLQHPLYSHFGKKMDKAEARRSLGVREDSKVLLFFGLVRHYKGLDILLEAFNDMGEGYELVIAGEPYGSFDKYQELIDGGGAKDRIHCFLSYIKDSEVSRYFSAADLAVLPYRSATQSGISSVAYHFELPMVVTDVGGLKETIGDRGTGLVVDNAEPGQIKAAIEEYFSDESARERLVDNIRAEKERLSWSAFCQSLTAFSQKL